MVPVAFLGICDSSNGYADFFDGFWRQDFIGVRRHVLSPVFPWVLANEQLLFALYEPLGCPGIRIRLVDPRGEEVFFITLAIESKEEVAIARSESVASVRPGSPALALNAPPAYGEGTKWITIAITPPQGVLVSPGEYRVEATVAGVTETIGCVDCIALNVPPLSDEVVAAIKADPLAAKEARLELACSACEAKIRAYAALARSNSTEQAGFAW